MRRLAPYGLVIGAFYLGVEVGWRWGRKVMADQVEAALNSHPLAYLAHLREEFGDLTTEPSTEDWRKHCGYCGAKAYHVESRDHAEHCPYHDPTLAPPPDEQVAEFNKR